MFPNQPFDFPPNTSIRSISLEKQNCSKYPTGKSPLLSLGCAKPFFKWIVHLAYPALSAAELVSNSTQFIGISFSDIKEEISWDGSWRDVHVAAAGQKVFWDEMKIISASDAPWSQIARVELI